MLFKVLGIFLTFVVENCRLGGQLSLVWLQWGNMGWKVYLKCWRMSLSSPWPFLAVLLLSILQGVMWWHRMNIFIQSFKLFFFFLMIINVLDYSLIPRNEFSDFKCPRCSYQMWNLENIVLFLPFVLCLFVLLIFLFLWDMFPYSCAILSEPIFKWQIPFSIWLNLGKWAPKPVLQPQKFALSVKDIDYTI